MEPLKVTFTFATPVFKDSEYPIHFDALVAYCVMREAEKYEYENPWQEADDLSSCIERTDGPDWVWKASKIVFTPASGIQFQNMLRKSDPTLYYEEVGKSWAGRGATEQNPIGNINPDTFRINTGSGQQRGYQWLAASQWMEKAEAWVIGDKEVLEGYLNSHIRNVGKVGRNGYGRILSIRVESSDEPEKWRLRVLPQNESGLPGIQYESVQACIRAPYWKKLERIVAKEPLV